VEAYCTTVAVRDEDFAITIGQADTDQPPRPRRPNERLDERLDAVAALSTA